MKLFDAQVALDAFDDMMVNTDTDKQGPHAEILRSKLQSAAKN